MIGPSGKWLTEDEFAAASGLDREAARARIQSLGLLAKTVAGRNYVWTENPVAADASAPDLGARVPSPAQPSAPPPTAIAPVEGEPLPARFTGVEQLALQTERAISLVERSLSAFMMMHQEVVTEKDRFVSLTREGVGERDRLIEEGRARLDELGRQLRDKDQEIADLRMLVEILEGGKKRPAPAEGEITLEPPVGRASVGDLMEEQLRYLMEDQMVKDLLEK
jgi:hypothetical protein